MKEFNKLNEFKNFKFQSVIPQDILQAVSLLERIGYEVVRYDFSADDAAKHNGVCAWDDGEITEGWLEDSNFKTVTLDDLKEMVGETNMRNNTLSNNFTVAWEQVFGEKFIDSVIKAVKQNKDNTINNNKFTLERLLGCEVLFGDTLYHVHYIYHAGAVGHLVLETDTRRAYVSDFNLLTFFTEGGDELTFDEYVEMYYGEHSIFEHGDYIVWLFDYEPTHLYQVKYITEKGCGYGNDWGWYGVLSNEGVGYSFRHATDEEIKAGRRL